MKYPCPQCKTEIEYSKDNPHRPFCCERCKLLDLGDWAAENHKISRPSLEDELFSNDFEKKEL